MGLLTDLWNKICEFFQIEVAEPIVPETKDPPKPYEPVESVTPLPEKPVAEAPIEEIEPLPSEPSHVTPIGEQGKADRIKVIPAKEEPVTPTTYPYFTYSTDPVEEGFTKPPSVEDFPCKMRFYVKDKEGAGIAGASVTFLSQTATTDPAYFRCEISGRARCNKNYPITASKAGYKTLETKIGFTSGIPPHMLEKGGNLGGTKNLYLERL